MNREEVMRHPLRRLAVRNRRGRYIGAAVYYRRFVNQGLRVNDYEYHAATQSTYMLMYQPSKRHGERYRTVNRLEKRLRKRWFYGTRRAMGLRDFKCWLHNQARPARLEREEVVRQALQRARAKGKREHLRYQREGGNWRLMVEEYS